MAADHALVTGTLAISLHETCPGPSGKGLVHFKVAKRRCFDFLGGLAHMLWGLELMAIAREDRTEGGVVPTCPGC